MLSKMICKRGLQMKNRIWRLLALIMTLAFVPLLAGEAEENPERCAHGRVQERAGRRGEAVLQNRRRRGPLTHGHVADDIIIYGNGARVSGGECDLEIDTYKFDRKTGEQSASGHS